MKKYLKKTKAKLFIMKFIAWMLIAISIPVIYSGFEDLFREMFTKTNLWTEGAADCIVPGEYYVLDDAEVLDWYAEGEDGKYYIVPILEEENSEYYTYMGLYLPEKYAELAERNMNGDADARITGRGYVYTMDGEEAQYFAEYICEALEDEEIAAYLCYQTAVLESPAENLRYIFTQEDGIGAAVTIVLLWGGAIGLLIAGSFRRYKKKVFRVMEDNHISEEQVAADLDHGAMMEEKPSYRRIAALGRKYMLVYGLHGTLVPYENIVWAYQSVTRTRHRVYGVIPVGTSTTYAVRFILKDKSKVEFACQKEQVAQDILHVLGNNAPWIILGYEDALNEVYNNNFSQMVAEVEERKLENL